MSCIPFMGLFIFQNTHPPDNILPQDLLQQQTWKTRPCLAHLIRYAPLAEAVFAQRKPTLWISHTQQPLTKTFNSATPVPLSIWCFLIKEPLAWAFENNSYTTT